MQECSKISRSDTNDGVQIEENVHQYRFDQDRTSKLRPGWRRRVRHVARRLDETDQRILSELAEDGRMSMRTLADKLHISRANAYARVERLRADGVIRGFRADVDPVASGLGTTAYVTINLRQADWRKVREQLRALDGVVHIGLVGGEFDVILLVRARDNADLRRLVLDDIQSMPAVRSTRTLLVFEEVQSDIALPGLGSTRSTEPKRSARRSRIDELPDR
jgi:DNA-binding Lrp family transcriptional regulator